MPDPKHLIHTGRDGVLDSTTTAHIDDMMSGIRQTGKAVIHLHGGLVKESSALGKADELLPVYSGAGAYPVFFVYETGLLEIVRNNLGEIAKEKVFKRLLKKLLKYAAGKLANAGGLKAAGGGYPMPTDIEVSIEVNQAASGQEPYKDFQVTNPEELTEEEENLFRDALVADAKLQEELQAVVNGAADFDEVQSSAKGVTLSHQVSSETLMSPQVMQQLVEDARLKEGKGLFSSAKFLINAGKILGRVVRRHVTNRDHGLYTTVVEELLREYYIANIGATVWGAMKKETADTFDNSGGGDIRGGWYFVEQLAKVIKDGDCREVTVVGHSLGSVFACNLIDHLAAARQDSNHPLPADFQLKDLIFLAPAVTHERFALTLGSHSDLFQRFRAFNLSDELEAGYWEVPVIYPRSLLYLVSGLFEEDADGDGAYDKPLVGMQRYVEDSSTYDDEGVPEIRSFLKATVDRVYYSITDQGPGKATDALKHGGFDDWANPAPRKTVESVVFMLSENLPTP